MGVPGNAKVPSDLERSGMSKALIVRLGRHSRGADYLFASEGDRGRGGRGVVAHAGTRLLADLADRTGLTSGFIQALGLARQRRSAHDPGRVAVDLAVLLADGGEAIADLAALRQQPRLFGSVASDATAWRVLDGIDESALARLRAARAAAPGVGVGADGLDPPLGAGHGGAGPAGAGVRARYRRDDRAVPLREGSGGADLEAHVRLPPAAVFPRQHREALAGLLCPGNAGSNTAADHITATRAGRPPPRPAHGRSAR